MAGIQDAGAAVLQSAIKIVKKDLTFEGASDLGAMFRRAGLSMPQALWSPDREDMDQALFRSFFDALAPARSPQGHVTARGLKLVELAPFAKSLIRVIPNEGCTDFLYTHYGRDIEALYGRTLVGQTCLNGFDALISKYFYANYRAVCQSGTSCFTRHEPPHSVFANWWRRYVVPVMDADGSVNEIITLSQPDNVLCPGFNAIPFSLFVVNENHHVTFANRMAQVRFGHRKPYFETTIESYCGFENFDTPAWNLGPFKTDARFSQSVRTQQMVTTLDQKVLHLEITGSPLIFRDRGFRLVLIREL